jgi:hypothetical protein
MFHPEPDILKDCDLLFFIERFQYTQEPCSNAIVIDIIKVKDEFRKQGVCRGILKYLKGQGIIVNVNLSTIEAYDFWVKMHQEGLIQNIPDKSMERRI